MREQTSLPHTSVPVGRLWNGVKGNYDTNRAPIDLIVIHTMEGTTPGSTAHFKNVNTDASAHYGVSLDGSLVQWIPENHVSYHAGDYPTNRRAIGIEHEDGYNRQTRPNASYEPRPDALYETSAKLVAELCTFYKIPADRQHIKGHKEVSQKPKSCPGSLDVNRIVLRAKDLMSGVPTNEPLASHMLQPSVFKKLVTKSTNWDDFCVALGISKEASEQYEMGKKVANSIISRLEMAQKTSSISTTGTPEPSVTTVSTGSPPFPPPNISSTAPNDPQMNKNVWKTDVLDVLKALISTIQGRVTLR